MMRIAIEATSAAPGGGLSMLRGAVRALTERGDVALDLFAQPAVAAESFGPRVRAHAVGPFRGLAHRMAWVQCVFPGLARAHDAIFAPGNLAPLRRAGRTVLFVQNAHVVPQELWRAEYDTARRRLQRAMARLSIRRCARVLFISETLKAWARPYWATNAIEPGIAHPGVPLAAHPPPVRRAGRDVLVVGSLVPHKRVDRAVRAFGLLARQGASYGRLRIAGGGGSAGLLGSLRDCAARAGVADRVDFLGFLGPPSLCQAYATSGCYLSTSALEALALPPLEAMAVGTPVVVPDSAMFREVCGPAALYFSDDDDAIARRLGDALDHPPEPGELRRAAHERAATFSWPEFADRVVSACASAARECR